MEYFTYPQSKPVWFSFENPTGGRNNGGLDNFGAKGHPFELLKDGEEKILCDTDGPGVIRRIWLTLDDRSEQTLRHTRLRMYWENEKTPAVDVPVGDFFCMGHGKMRVFENALFSSPEGRSFHCTVSMPFLRHARITITNQSGKDNKHIFYEINMTKEPLPDNILYFHTIHTITEKNELGTEVPILPKTDGIGRFLGTSIALRINDAYVESWWGEGEVKFYFGDDEHPTLNGTGTEDYIGTAWGQATFSNRTQGCLLYEDGLVTFYRLHLDDAICFYDGIRVTIQDIGGCGKPHAQELFESGIPMIPTAADQDGTLIPLYRKEFDWDTLPDSSFVSFYRQDSFEATAYFYWEHP